MSIRCKVCNSSKVLKNSESDSNENWECQVCGNILDSKGFIVSVE